MDENQDSGTTLMSLVGEGDCEAVNCILKKGDDVNFSDKNGKTLVHIAAEKGFVDMLQILHGNGANLDVKDINGRNIIWYALMKRNNYSIIRWLTQQDVDVKCRDKEGFTPAHHAASTGDLDMLKLLHSNGAHIHQVSRKGYTSIMAAVDGTCDYETVRWLIKQQVDINCCDKDGLTPAYYAARKGNLAVLKLLEKNGADIHQVSSDGANCIMAAIRGSGNFDTVMWLIEQHVDVNCCDNDGFTPAHIASEKGNLDVLNLLHSNGAEINQVSTGGLNCIMSASCGTGDCDTVLWLIKQNLYVNYCDKSGRNAAHYAARKGNLDVLKMLYIKGTDIHQVSRNGLNCILSALLGSGDCDTVRWLIKENVDIKCCDEYGLTPAHYAAATGNLAVLKLLHRNKADIHRVNNNGFNTIVATILGTCDPDVMTWLIEQDVSIKCRDKHGLTPVFYAAYKGSLEILKLLHNKRAHLHQVSTDGHNAITAAIIGTGDCDTVSWLLTEQVGVNCPDKYGFTVVHYAARKGDLVMLKLLHNRGADIHRESSDGQNCIMAAICGNGDCDTVLWLIEQGVDVNWCDQYGCTSAHYAAKKGNLDVLKLLHSKGADIHHVNSDGDNSLMEAIFGSCDYNTVMWLIKQHVDVKCLGKDGLTAVHRAAHNGNLYVLKLLHSNRANIHEVSSDGFNSVVSATHGTCDFDTVKWLIEQGVDVNKSDKYGHTAVHYAARKGNLDVLHLLHSNGADIQQLSSGCQNSIMAAIHGSGNCDTVKWLAEKHVDVNWSDKDNFTSVHYAAYKGNLPVLKLLHSNGADINQVSSGGHNSIMLAILGTGFHDTVKWLIEQDVDVNRSDKYGRTAVLYAARKGNLDVLKLLHHKKADIHQVSSDGINSIMAAILGSCECDTVRWLIEQQVDINFCDKYGLTSAHYAARKGNLAVLKLLHINGANIHQGRRDNFDTIMAVILASCNHDIATWLIEQGVNIDKSSSGVITAIHMASSMNNLSLLKLFKKYEFNFLVLDKWNNNAVLYNTFIRGNAKVVQWLTEQGLDVNHCNDDGCCALHYAANSGMLSVVKMLCSMGADINARDKLQRNALHFAALGNSNLETVTWLVESNINVLNLDCDGNSALHYAAAQDQAKILKHIATKDKQVSRQSNSRLVFSSFYIYHADIFVQEYKITFLKYLDHIQNWKKSKVGQYTLVNSAFSE